MPHQKNSDSYIQFQYSMLQPVGQNAAANFSEELSFFIYKHAELSTSKQLLKSLHYCFVHYINLDRESRDFPVQEKLKQAMEMAKRTIID